MIFGGAMNKELLKADIESVLSDKYEVTADKAQPYQLHEALSSAIMKQIAPVWKDSRKAPEAAEVMKVTAAHLKELGIIERIIPEEYPASEENLPEIAEYMKIRMKQFLVKQAGKSGEQIAQERYERFRKM